MTWSKAEVARACYNMSKRRLVIGRRTRVELEETERTPLKNRENLRVSCVGSEKPKSMCSERTAETYIVIEEGAKPFAWDNQIANNMSSYSEDGNAVTLNREQNCK